MKIKKITTILFIVLLTAGIGYYIYQDQISTQDHGDDNNVSSEQEDINNSDGSVEDLPSNPSNKEEEIPQPSLDMPILKVDPFGGAMSNESIKEAEDLVVKLKEGGYYFKDWNELALYRKATGDYDGALEIWEYSIIRWPNGFIPYLNLANLHGYYLHNNSKAEGYYKDAIEKDPSYVATYLDLSAFYKEAYTEKADLADNILLDGLKNNPGDISLQIALATYYAEEGDTVNSRKYYDLAITQAKDMGDAILESQLQEELDNLTNQ